jgi:hypothetical protein
VPYDEEEVDVARKGVVEKKKIIEEVIQPSPKLGEG